jgi:hypothetical protein
MSQHAVSGSSIQNSAQSVEKLFLVKNALHIGWPGKLK